MRDKKYVYNTLGWWFKKLPTSARIKARRNACHLLNLNYKPFASNLAGALGYAFAWSMTPEGYDYWLSISVKYGKQR